MDIYVVERWTYKHNKPDTGFQFMFAFKNFDDAKAYAVSWIQHVLVDPTIEYMSDAEGDYVICYFSEGKYLFRIKETTLVESFEKVVK